MPEFITKERKLVILFVLALIIRILSAHHQWIEQYYSTGIYPHISAFLRIFFGWLPFSLGDLLYISVFIWLVYHLIRFFLSIRKHPWRNYFAWNRIRKFFLAMLWIYLFFNIAWGLNYNRQGIAKQLNLQVNHYSVQDLETLTTLLQQRLNSYGDKIDSIERLTLNSNQKLFSEGVNAYKIAKDSFPFLLYKYPSLKPSMISHIGQYFGFTGYYNPFSGEAQLKTTVPVFLKPFIITHEIAHQLGYAKENEANFVGYLACKNAADINFRYSVYFELTLYALGDLRSRDSLMAKEFKTKWNPRVKYDYKDFITYLIKSENPVEPLIMRFYDQYLKMNSQPKGYRTYNEVIAWLIAYMKHYGEQAI